MKFPILFISDKLFESIGFQKKLNISKVIKGCNIFLNNSNSSNEVSDVDEFINKDKRKWRISRTSQILHEIIYYSLLMIG